MFLSSFLTSTIFDHPSIVIKKSDGCWYSSTGIPPLQVFLPALLIACDALNARTMTIGEYHYPN
ncbi:hypothetical protein DTX80_05395 [Bacilli bacterium]|nr:hypothetical protein DEJ64_05410 [Bacilli bacterium]PZD90693.1 hypothetical protein DEJ60_02210 [Bacilli bacterium]PZD91828.1 hypothetical protein DEJ66_05275 [Bacilli bacterium]RCO06560.1 hypothetical protein DTX80_05395 [Bacilli bacterium]RCO10552.1 hypothetical protein DTX79_03795 [Bacilli bacterium]